MKRDFPDETSSDDGEEDDNMSMVDVDFDFFNLNTKVDFHAFNTLLKQLFGADAVKFELGTLADLFLDHPIGSTVKVDGEESDPFAVLSVLNLQAHKGNAQIKLIREYILEKTKSDEKVHKFARKLIDAKTGFLFSERLINMPVDIAPPLYRILKDEMQDKEEYAFDHFILWSKSYIETTSKIDDDRPKKKSKSTKEMFYFHAEDEFLIKHASHSINFKYSNQSAESDSKRAFHDFGIAPSGLFMFFTRDGFNKAVQELQTAIQ